MYTVECDACGQRFTATRSTALTCSAACRQRRHKERKAAAAVAAALDLARIAHAARTASDPHAALQSVERRAEQLAESLAPRRRGGTP
ncbi:hypothetical protein ASD19_06330 [Microbacterium sp. Root53]|uniref:hypothetical protein n=1 Tax=Microbacterium sp. Root53 TaxID=1736553 RepID=UPI0006FF5E06|nr:hypothetical protein [Microbacterium sp. Root53]KQY98822.1 hypothetical protein ASD19_06330 [Microbacterium sp. Root53]